MGRTYITDNPSWVCDVLSQESDTMTLTVCADTPHAAADAALREAVKVLGEGHQIKTCIVYGCTTNGTAIMEVPFHRYTHTPNQVKAHKFTVIK